jgi:phosphoserine phosphatase
MTAILRTLAVLLAAGWCATPAAAEEVALPSWIDGPARGSIIAFVESTTTVGGEDFVPPDERVAVFDNDGTLWLEQPYYTQLAFALDRVKALAAEHPEWQEQQPFKAVLENDVEALKAAGMEGVVALIVASHAGVTTDEFETIVTDWLASAEHPRFARPYTELVYLPMLELLDYLRDNGFKTYIVSGGGVEFMRPWAEEAYGIPTDQVVGSSIETTFELRDGQPVLVRLPEIDFVNDGAGKPVGIHKFIGRRPIAAFGNSDGDLAMLQWTTRADGRGLGVIVHHDDAEREYAYDRESSIGHLDRALDAAESEGWVVVSMKDDWRTVFVDAPK